MNCNHYTSLSIWFIKQLDKVNCDLSKEHIPDKIFNALMEKIITTEFKDYFPIEFRKLDFYLDIYMESTENESRFDKLLYFMYNDYYGLWMLGQPYEIFCLINNLYIYEKPYHTTELWSEYVKNLSNINFRHDEPDKHMMKMKYPEFLGETDYE